MYTSFLDLPQSVVSFQTNNKTKTRSFRPEAMKTLRVLQERAEVVKVKAEEKKYQIQAEKAAVQFE